jgi:hypothetical protein
MSRFLVGLALLAAVTAVLVPIACGSSTSAHGWPPAAKKRILAGCEKGDRICVCITNRLEQTVSYGEMLANAKATAQFKGPVWAKTLVAMTSCGAFKSWTG